AHARTSATATTPTNDARPASMAVAKKPEASVPASDRPQVELDETARWMRSDRFAGLRRLYSPRQVVEQRGAIRTDYAVACDSAVRMYARLRELFEQGGAITTFGPYSPG